MMCCSSDGVLKPITYQSLQAGHRVLVHKVYNVETSRRRLVILCRRFHVWWLDVNVGHCTHGKRNKNESEFMRVGFVRPWFRRVLGRSCRIEGGEVRHELFLAANIIVVSVELIEITDERESIFARGQLGFQAVIR